MAMRFIFISTLDSAPWGGSEELWGQTALRLAAAGHQVGACLTGWPDTHPRVQALIAGGVAIHFRRLLFPSFVKRVARRLQRRPPEMLTNKVALEWLGARGADLVVINHGGGAAGVEWMLGCRRLGLPYVALAHGADERFWPSEPTVADLALAYGGMRRAFFVSRGNQILFEEELGQRLPHAEIVRNPYNVPYDANLAWPDSTAGLQLACVARLAPDDKGQDVLFRALARPKWRERKLRINLFGDGSRRPALERLARLLDVPHVTFGGYQPNMEALWSTHHALLLPSRIEGLPIALVEAMLCGRPAIVTDVAGNCEMIEDNVNGFVAAAPTAELFDAALERAWQRREDWPALGRSAQSTARHLVPPDPAGVMADKLCALARADVQ
jgi:glycosyltransferase involved in cell wall biosynthesis